MTGLKKIMILKLYSSVNFIIIRYRRDAKTITEEILFTYFCDLGSNVLIRMRVIKLLR